MLSVIVVVAIVVGAGLIIWGRRAAGTRRPINDRQRGCLQ